MCFDRNRKIFSSPSLKKKSTMTWNPSRQWMLLGSEDEHSVRRAPLRFRASALSRWAYLASSSFPGRVSHMNRSISISSWQLCGWTRAEARLEWPPPPPPQLRRSPSFTLHYLVATAIIRAAGRWLGILGGLSDPARGAAFGALCGVSVNIFCVVEVACWVLLPLG